MQTPALVRRLASTLCLLLVVGASAAQGRPAGDAEAGRESQASAPKSDDDKKKEKAKEKPGIPVEDVLVQSLCGRCHTRDDREHMTRISYVRKSPEGWAQTIKRMGRLHGCLLYTSPSPRDLSTSRMPSSA